MNQIDVSKLSNDLNRYIEFVVEIISNNSIAHEKQQLFTKKINSIIEKQNDPNLYLGIIGEFSSGKTTLLNSLLEDDFLKTDAIQGTTTSTTFFRYSEKIGLSVTMKDGQILEYSNKRRRLESTFLGRTISSNNYRFINFFRKKSRIEKEDKQRIGLLIEKITTSDVNTSKVKRVDVYYPSEILKKGIVIIDTPGTDIEKKEHLKITETAIRENCDSALIIVPSEKPASQSLVDFLKNSIADTIHRCKIFVTKVELLRNEQSRHMVLRNVSQRISSSLLIPNLAAYEAPTLLHLEESSLVEKSDLLKRVKDEDKTKMLANYKKLKETIFNGLVEQRLIIQTEKTIRLINEILEVLGIELNQLNNTYKREHQELVDNTITNLSDFTKTKKQNHKSSFANSFDKAIIEASNNIDIISSNCIQDICITVNSCTKKLQVRKAVKNENLRNRLNAAISNLSNEIESQSLDLYKFGTSELKTFENEFSEIYNKLSLLKSGVYANFKSHREISSQFRRIHINSFSIEIGVFELISGWFNGETLLSLKQRVCTQVRGNLNSEFGKAKTIANNTLNENYNIIWNQISEIIDLYMSEYGTLVQQLIDEDNRKKRILKGHQKRINQELSEITQKKDELIELINNLKQI